MSRTTSIRRCASRAQRLVYSEWESKKALDGARQFLQGTPLATGARTAAAAPERLVVELVGPVTSTKGLDLPETAVAMTAVARLSAATTGAQEQHVKLGKTPGEPTWSHHACLVPWIRRSHTGRRLFPLAGPAGAREAIASVSVLTQRSYLKNWRTCRTSRCGRSRTPQQCTMDALQSPLARRLTMDSLPICARSCLPDARSVKCARNTGKLVRLSTPAAHNRGHCDQNRKDCQMVDDAKKHESAIGSILGWGALAVFALAFGWYVGAPLHHWRALVGQAE